MNEIKKSLIVLVIFSLFVIPFVSANLIINASDKGSSVVSELSSPAVFDLIINNSGVEDKIEVYSLAGMVIEPKEILVLPHGTTTFEIKAYPNDILREQKGKYNFEYQINSQNQGIIKDELQITMVKLKDSLSFSSQDLEFGDHVVRVKVKNTQNAFIDGLKIAFSSAFFDEEKVVSLKPFEEIIVPVNVNKPISNLIAGSYVFSVNSDANGYIARFESSFNYLPREDTSSVEKRDGFFTRTYVQQRTNNGNVPIIAKIEMKKDVLSRLFTVFSIEPTNVRREGTSVFYTWQKNDLAPTQTFMVSATTSYTFPILFLILLIVVGVLVYSYTRTSVLLTKRVSFVKTRGGEFALKVRLQVKARKYVEDLEVIDMLPGMTMLYEKFGIKPNKIDHATRRLFWNIERLNAGEERVFSYIIYSKIKVVGKFELPSATALFDREGTTHEVHSNRTYFISDNSSKSD